jgi:hypothetical protein
MGIPEMCIEIDDVILPMRKTIPTPGKLYRVYANGESFTFVRAWLGPPQEMETEAYSDPAFITISDSFIVMFIEAMETKSGWIEYYVLYQESKVWIPENEIIIEGPLC